MLQQWIATACRTRRLARPRSEHSYRRAGSPPSRKPGTSTGDVIVLGGRNRRSEPDRREQARSRSDRRSVSTPFHSGQETSAGLDPGRTGRRRGSAQPGRPWNQTPWEIVLEANVIFRSLPHASSGRPTDRRVARLRQVLPRFWRGRPNKRKETKKHHLPALSGSHQS